MLKKITVWGAALAAIVAALLVIRMGPDGAPDVVEVLEQAPLPLPTGPRETLDELQRQIQLPQEPAGESTPEPPAVASDEPEFRRGSRRLAPLHVRLRQRRHLRRADVARRKRRCLRRRFSAPTPSRFRRPKSLLARATRPAIRVFWSHGGVATFEIRGQSFVDCTSNPGAARSAEARRREVTFRAFGNEPSWVLEISPQQLTLTTELGQRRTEFPYRDPARAGARTTYRSFAGTQELVVAIDRMRCNDTMSGELFDYTVAVTFESTTLYGCGSGRP